MKKSQIRNILSSVVLVSLTLIASTSKADVVADSVADFSGIQGENGWQYGYYAGTFTPSNFIQMTNFNQDISSSVGAYWQVSDGVYWTALWASGGHPNGTTTSGGRTPVDQWAVRRWVSDVSGTITITGNIGDLNSGTGNGVTGHIYINNTEVQSLTIDNGNATGTDYSFQTNVNVGTFIDFAIDPRDSNDLADSTRFTAQILSTPVPEPESYFMMLAGLGLIGFATTRRKHV